MSAQNPAPILTIGGAAEAIEALRERVEEIALAQDSDRALILDAAVELQKSGKALAERFGAVERAHATLFLASESVIEKLNNRLALAEAQIASLKADVFGVECNLRANGLEVVPARESSTTDLMAQTG